MIFDVVDGKIPDKVVAWLTLELDLRVLMDFTGASNDYALIGTDKLWWFSWKEERHPTVTDALMALASKMNIE